MATSPETGNLSCPGPSAHLNGYRVSTRISPTGSRKESQDLQPDEGVAPTHGYSSSVESELLTRLCGSSTQSNKYVAYGSGLLTGVQLDSAAQQQFADHQPWDGPPNPQMGHDVWMIKTHITGAVAVVTWGAIQECTLNFRQNNITDLWLITDKDDPAVNNAALQAALLALAGTGTV